MNKNALKKNNLEFIFFYSKENDKYLKILKKMIIEKLESATQTTEGIKK